MLEMEDQFICCDILTGELYLGNLNNKVLKNENTHWLVSVDGKYLKAPSLDEELQKTNGCGERENQSSPRTHYHPVQRSQP